MTNHNSPMGLMANAQARLNFTRGTTPGRYSHPSPKMKKYWPLHPLSELKSLITRVVVRSQLEK